MKKKDFVALRAKKTGELKDNIRERKNELIQTMGKIKAGEEKNLKKPHNLRLEIARMLSMVREKEILEKETRKEEVKK